IAHYTQSKSISPHVGEQVPDGCRLLLENFQTRRAWDGRSPSAQSIRDRLHSRRITGVRSEPGQREPPPAERISGERNACPLLSVRIFGNRLFGTANRYD